MTGRPSRRAFASRPADPDTWIKAVDNQSARAPELRGRIKIVAFQRGVTVADMLRELLAREFPSCPGAPS